MRDESYEAGYRAGHLQGWLDAMAKVQASQKAPPAQAGRPALARFRSPSGFPAPSGFPSPSDFPSPAGSPTPAGTPVRGWISGAPAVPEPLAVTEPPAAHEHSSTPAVTVNPASAWQAVTPRPVYSAAPAGGARGPVAVPAQVFQPSPGLTPAEEQARRERRDRQNINVTLYVASLLLVAAAALFIGTSLPPTLRFAGVCAVTAMFYAAGFVLHARVPRLRPAAVAFAGTGLALIPVTGMALYNFALHHGPSAWLITSLIGTVAYVAAAVRLESRVLVYLSLTFVASTAWSGVSVLGGALVWYFAVLIGVAVLLTALAMARPGWLPPVYVRPLMVLHPFVVPAVAVAVTCVPLLLDRAEYALIMGMSGCYFALMAALPGGRLKLLNFYAARISLTVAAAVEVWDLTGRGADSLLAAAALLAVQAAVVASAGAKLGEWFPDARPVEAPADGAAEGGSRWRLDGLVTFSIQLVATLAFAVQTLSAEFYRNGTLAQETAVPLWVPVLLALATSFVLAARLGGRAEWAPVAALVLAGVVGYSMGAWPLAGMLVLTSVFWSVRARTSAGTLRGQLVLAARVAITLAVPVTVAAVVDDGPHRTAVSVFSLLVALVCQQLLSAVVQRSGVRAFAPEASLAGFAAAGAATLAVLPFLDTTPGNGLSWPAVLFQLVAALLIGWLLTPRPATDLEWQATVGEALPLVISAVAVSVAFLTVSLGSGNMALLLVLGYLLVTAVRLPARQHRWAYWWLSRGAATLLVLTAFEQLQRNAGATVIADEVLRPATVLVSVLGLQLIFPLAAAVRRRAPRWVLADAAVVLLVQLAGCAVFVPLETEAWQATFAAVVVALSAAASGYVFRSHDRAGWFAPASLAALLAFSRGELLMVELLLGVFAIYSAVMVVAVPQPTRKGWYFVAARVLTAGLAAVLSYDVTASPAAVSVTFALVLAAQHAVRWVMRARLAEIPFQQAAVWITLAGQALLPLAYALQSDAARGRLLDDDGGRWVVLLELALLLVSAVVAKRLFAAHGALYFAVYALLFGVLSLGPLISFGTDNRLGTGTDGTFLAAPILDHTGTAAVLLCVALLAAAAGALRRSTNVPPQDVDHWLWLCTAVSFSLAALFVSPLASEWVPGAAVLALAAVCFTASHVERQPFLYAPAAAALLVGSTVLADAAFEDAPGEWAGYLPWLVGTGLAAVGLYGARLIRTGTLKDDPVRRWSLAGAAFLGFCLVALNGVGPDSTSWVAAAALAAAVGVAYGEAPAAARRIVAEVGAVAVVAAVQRAAIFELDGQYGYNYRLSLGLPDPFWVAQWYVVLGACLGALRYASGQRTAGRTMLGAAAGLLSLSGLGVVFGGTGGQQLWVLVLFAVLLLAGLGLGDRLFVWWGAAGVAACVLWAMRQYTFALLALIAVGLIVFAVWRLNRGTAAETAEAQPDPGQPAPQQRDEGREPSGRP